MSRALDPRLAADIIRRMGETGQPPERGALEVNAGTDHLLKLLHDDYLVPIRETSRYSSFKLVEADFGGGKTQFLTCLREIAWKEGFVTGLITLSPKECPFDDSRRIYMAVARELELPPDNPADQPDRGIDAVLRAVVRKRVKTYGEDVVRNWLDDVATAPNESYGLRRAATVFMRGVLDKDETAAEIAGAFLRGDELQNDELKMFGIRERLDRDTAFRFLRGVVQLAQVVGIPGMVLLFDEMDRNLSLPHKRRAAIGDNLRQMIDLCGTGRLPGLLWVYAVPPEFRTRIIQEYPALQQRLDGVQEFSRRSPLAPVINLEKIEGGPTELMCRIGERIAAVFEAAFSPGFTPSVQSANVALAAREFGENQLQVGARRQFVKAVIAMLEDQRGNERTLGIEDVRALSRRMSTTPPPMDGEREF